MSEPRDPSLSESTDLASTLEATTEETAADDATVVERRTQHAAAAAQRRANEPATTKAALAARRRRSLPIIDPSLYELGEEIAHGGMGRIRSARDVRLDREVAIKEIKEARGNQAARFEREALVTARLQHPSIVAIYEAGHWPSGEPFYAMKLVRGRSLRRVIEHAADFDARLALLPHVIAVADAMAYAHEHRVIHRDLKPSNVLVGDFGETVVIDWGIAKDLKEEDLKGTPAQSGDPTLTRDGSVMGTPNYMPPEQARGTPVDERADVYAIGAILYHLLAGEPPYAGADSTHVLAAVAREPPVPLDRRERRVPPDLLAIVERAMARDPDARYRTARDLAEDLRRFQTGQLVASHHYSRMELVARFARRHRGVLLALAAAAIAIGGVGVFSIAKIVQERNTARAAERHADAERVRAERERALAIDETDRGLIADAEILVDSEPDAALRKLLQLSPGTKHVAEAHVIASDARARGIPRTVDAHAGGVVALAVSSDGRTIATAGADLAVSVWDAATLTRRDIGKHAMAIYAVAISPDGKSVASASSDETVRIWSLDGRELGVLQHSTAVVDAAFSPDGALLATSSDDGVRVWSVAERTVRAASPLRASTLLFVAPTSLVYESHENLYRLDLVTGATRLAVENAAAWALSFDRSRLATATKDGVFQLWDTTTWRAETLDRLVEPRALAYSPDGRRVAVISNDGPLTIWDLDGEKSRRAFTVAISGRVRAIEFTPDGGGVLVRGETTELLSISHVDTDTVTSLAGSNDVEAVGFAGTHLIGARRGKLVAWPWRAPARLLAAPGRSSPPVRYLPDGRLVTTGHNTLSIGERTIELPFQTLGPFVVDHRGVRAATVDRDGLLRIVELATGDVRIIGSALENHLLFADVAIDETGRWVAVQGKGHTVRVIDVQDASERSFATDAANLQFTSDSRWIVTGRMPDLHLFSVATGDVRAETVPVVHPGANGPMSADIVTGAGSTIAGIQYEGTVTVGDVLDPRSWWTIESSRPITTIAFSPDGALLGVGDIDGIVGVWRVKDRKRITSFDVGSTAHVVAFSLDGASCVVGTTQTSVLHSIPTGLQRKLYDRIAAGSLAFSPDGTRIAGLSEGLVREWPDDLPRDEAGLRAWIEQALR